MNPNSPKSERNKQIYQDRISGMSYRDLMFKYNLSLGRLQMIVDREAGREPRQVPKELPATETYEPSYVLQKLQTHLSRTLELAQGVTLEQLKAEWPKVDALLYNLERVGKGVQLLPQTMKEQYPQVNWERISEVTPVLIVRYWDVDYQECWEIIQDELPKLQQAIEQLAS